MGIFDRFPYSSTHEMNLDFMLGKATEIAEGMQDVQTGLEEISTKTEQATQAAAQAVQAAESIEGSVSAAEEAAEEAQMHNESAQTWANNAMTYKADCQRAASEAAASSTAAAQAATAAAASEDTVATYAQAANASAQSAANNNDSAHQYANQANASATNAMLHSTSAQTAATNAQTAATNATTSATNAETAATRAAALKDNCETLSQMSARAVDLAAEQAVAAANSAAQAAATKTDVENLVESLPEDFTDLNNTVNQLSDDIAILKIDTVKPVYGKIKPHVIFMPEFASDFWISNVLPSTLTGKESVFTFSGSEGDTLLTITSTTPETITPENVDIITGFVLTTDDIAYEPYNARYNSTEGKLEIYPPLSHNVENGKLCQFYLDSGTNYIGLHLTEHGYKAYTYNLYNKNPKHCEIGLYNAMYDAERDTTTHPFTKISSKQLYIGRSANGLSYSWLRNYFQNALNATFAASYTAYEEKNGIYWETNLHKTSGYLELFVRANAGFTVDVTSSLQAIKLPDDQHVFVDVYIDGVMVSRTEIDDYICRRICVDYENASTGKVEIYANKFASIDGQSYGFGVNKCTWWINQNKYPENAKLFPVGVSVAQEFDSWGVYNDGVTGKTLQALISADAGVTVPLENHSNGSQTTAWGLAYWYQNILAYHPQIAITDFLLNDNNSVNSGSIPATITGPDGKEYNNKITIDMYTQNMKKLALFALNNNIQPIMMRNVQHGYYRFPDAAINYLSEQYTP